MASTDPGEFAWMRRVLYTAVVADVLDSLGLRQQVAGVELRRVSGRELLIGRAKTMRWEDLEADDPRPYELELRAVDECQTNDVLVAAAGGSRRSGIWGELLSTAASNRGCVGAIVDGMVRDASMMHAIGFTVFARGTCPRDSLHRQRVTHIDVTVEVGGVQISPGDLLLADADGVVVVPAAVEREVLAKARDKTTAENRVREKIRSGVKAAEVFRKYGVL